MRLEVAQGPFGALWTDKLQGEIRSLLARAEHDRSFGPAACRRAINTVLELTIRAADEEEE